MAVLVELRKMRREDVSRVMEIERECFPIPWNESAYLTEVSNRSAYYVVAFKDTRLVGYAGMWLITDEAHITTLGVAKDSRGQKIGEQLLIALIDEALERGAKRATLEVRQSNAVAQGLYTKYGFSAAAIRRGYYTDNEEDAVVMWVDNLRAPVFLAKYRSLKQCLVSEAMQTPAEGVA